MDGSQHQGRNRRRPSVDDLTDRHPRAVPAPLGHLEPGWVGILADLFDRMDALFAG